MIDISVRSRSHDLRSPLALACLAGDKHSSWNIFTKPCYVWPLTCTWGTFAPCAEAEMSRHACICSVLENRCLQLVKSQRSGRRLLSGKGREERLQLSLNFGSLERRAYLTHNAACCTRCTSAWRGRPSQSCSVGGVLLSAKTHLQKQAGCCRHHCRRRCCCALLLRWGGGPLQSPPPHSIPMLRMRLCISSPDVRASPEPTRRSERVQYRDLQCDLDE